MAGGVVITHGLRSVYAKFGTALRTVSAVELGRQTITELVERADLDPQRVDEVIVGCAGNPIDAGNVARGIARSANRPTSVSATAASSKSAASARPTPARCWTRAACTCCPA